MDTPGRAAPRLRRVGLTGGIGSGKSTVAQLLVARGCVLVDTDAIARGLTAPGGAAMPALEERFGARVVRADGGLDRDAMRDRAFADPAAKRTLEAILHPLIAREAERRAEAAGDACVVFDVPLLAESQHWRDRVERVLVADCSEATQVARVMQRSGWTEDGVRRVIAAQATRDERRRCADAVITNDGIDRATLAAEVEQLAQRWGL
jgi:dephospho-CoA kinase